MAPQRDWLDKDFYAVLGVSSDATQDEIKKAYRKLARTNHPDANPDDPTAERRFKEVGEAYAVIGDAERRAEYDQLRRLGATGFGGGSPFGGATVDGDFSDLLRSIFDQGGGFGGGVTGARNRPRKGDDLRADVHLSFEDALAGVRTRLRVNGDGPCGTCSGTGAAPGTQPHACARCGGRGQVAADQGLFSIAQPCPACGGRGVVIEQHCPTCGGDGRVPTPRELTVRIPPGVRDGATIRLPQRGGAGRGGGPPGDVLVHVHVEPHRLFGRRGDDVTIEVPVSYSEAVLGAKLRVPTPDGGSTTIRIPAGTESGRTFRVRGKGAAGTRGRAGDLLVTVRIEVPRKVDRRTRKLLEELAEHTAAADRDELLFGAATQEV